jgi:hypothetical protein
MLLKIRTLFTAIQQLNQNKPVIDRPEVEMVASACMGKPTFASHRLSAVALAIVLSHAAAARAQEPRVVLERMGAAVVLEPYAPNIIRVSMSLDKEHATAPSSPPHRPRAGHTGGTAPGTSINLRVWL